MTALFLMPGGQALDEGLRYYVIEGVEVKQIKVSFIHKKLF